MAIIGKAHNKPMAAKWPLGVSLIVFALLQGPGAHAVEPVETIWKQSIEADLRNGDPTGQVCTKAKTRASISDDVTFKNWAYEVARRTCPPGSMGGTAGSPKPQAPQSPNPAANKTAPSTYTWGCPLLSAHDARLITKGRRLMISTGDCVMRFN